MNAARFKLLSTRFKLFGIALATIVVIWVAQYSFKHVRFDLTDEKLYSISDGSKNILKSLDKPVTLHYFFSDKLSKDTPQLRLYAQRVYELLAEYQRIAGSKLVLKKIDPEPFSEAEDEATTFGLTAIPMSDGNSMYLGLAATNESGEQEVVEFFHPKREAFLEYDLSRMIYLLGREKTPIVGVLSGLPIAGGFNPQTFKTTAPWVVLQQLEQLFDVEQLSGNVRIIDDAIDVLILVQPRSLSDDTLYAIDQFVLRGGRALFFVDPLAEHGQLQSLMSGDIASDAPNLSKLFDAWGVEFSNDKVLLDYQNAMVVPDKHNRPGQHLGIQGFGQKSFMTDDVFFKDLEKVLFSSSGVVKAKEGSTTQFTPIIQSSNEAMLVDKSLFQSILNPRQLFESFQSTGEVYTVAARIQGSVKSAFDKAPASGTAKKKGEDGVKEYLELPEHLVDSKQDIQVIIFTDTDVLSDRLWVRVLNFFGQRLTQPFADNGNLFINLVDHLFGNADLMSVRSRGQYARTFTRIEALRLDAAKKFQAQEKILEQRLGAVQKSLSSMQQPKEGDNKDKSIEINADQRAAIDKFNHELVDVRTQLRVVRHQMEKDISLLGTWLKLVNIGGVPFLLSFFAVGLHVHQRRRRKRVVEVG